MRDNTVDDSKTRVSIARMESGNYRRRISGVSFIAAAFWVASIAAALWIGVPLHWLVICAAGATILSLGAIVAEASRRLYVQNAFIEMTVSRLESELQRLHDRIGGLEVDVGKLGGEHRAYRF
jgi:hypothetical protein